MRAKRMVFCYSLILIFVLDNTRAFGAIDKPTPVKTEKISLNKLAENVRKKDLHDRSSAMDELRARGEEAVPVLLKMLKDADDDLRSRSVRALGELINPTYIPQIGETALKDSDPMVRSNALWALGETNDKSTASWFEKSLMEDTFIRNRGLAAIGYAFAKG
jgi:HEAT repeat protein